MGNSTHRMFLALWPDDAVRAALREHMQRWRWGDGARLCAAQDLHVTLHFLGAVPDERLPELREGFAVECDNFDWALDTPGLWPHGLAVLGCEDVPQPLLELYRRLGQAVQRLRLPLEMRSFRPHVTLARHALSARAPQPAPAIGWSVDGYCLVRSSGNPADRYEIVQRYPGRPAA
ncbi:MAG: hypothetical protein RJA36_27 [Pseudomonadota bacterium]|jgi:2'-5' RNA ligase